MHPRTEVTALVIALLSVALGAGCVQTTPPVPPAPRSSQGWETRRLAPGVELRISADASPGARLAAEGVESEYRSTYLNAR